MNVTIPASPEQQRRMDAQAEPVLQALVGATPAQIDAWLAANVTNLAQAVKVLRALALAVRHLYLRGGP